MWMVQVLCLGLVGTTIVRAQSYGALRLVRRSSFSSSYSSGRLEIYISGQWGTVCDDGWGLTDSNVACRQLGYSRATNYGTSRSSGFGSATGPIWLNNVRCSGSESRLTSCSYSSGSSGCSHSEDVAIYCTTSCTSYQWRCSNGQCISSYQRCNGYQQCTDGSDELNCPLCASYQWRCSNGQCISSYQRCNGYQQCSDGSDERDCTICSGSSFRCNNRQCIRSSGHCNGTRDCSDGSDEVNCTLSIIVGTTFGVLGLVTLLWCIIFCICMKVSTCPLHNTYYKRTIQNLAEAPPVQANPGAGVGGVTTLHPPPS